MTHNTMQSSFEEVIEIQNDNNDVQPDEKGAGQPGSKFSLATAFRSLGVMIVIAGMSAYLLEGWDTWNGADRYFVMIAGSGLLAIAGFVMSYLLKENKGARAFFGLALISVLANLTTLGGFIYSTVNNRSAGLLGMDWSLTGGVSVLMMMVTAVVVLVPIAWFAFKILNRPHANQLLALFVLSGGLLLLPFRSSLAIGALVIITLGAIGFYLHKVARNNPHFKTTEGRFTAFSLLAPVVIMVGRLLWLYEADGVIAWILCSIAFLATRYFSEGLKPNSISYQLNNTSGILFAAAIALFSSFLMKPYLPEEVLAPLSAVVFAALLCVIGFFGRSVNHNYGVAGLTILVLTVFTNTLLYDTTIATGSCVLMGMGLVYYGYTLKSLFFSALGAVSILLGLLPFLVELVGNVDFTSWITLSVLGVSVIVAGSLVERINRTGALQKWLKNEE